MDSPWMARLAAQSSMDTIGGNCTTATEDEECGLPRSTSKMPPWRDPACPRSPRTPQAQIVKNSFRATYRVSGRKASRSKLSFISPEIIRDGRHGEYSQ
ncbi:hypothetical protein HKI87_09g60000 [Chloropicon roscoffensis]|uniref:Uncharacterized protein n=1 Tax=Chloropicon roscoffensis TaxID=1461544 RepID=A0AAX4PFA8_9CHLO